MSTAKFNTWLNPEGTENYKCRAWVNFNGTGTVAIRASGNVSSITDNGTGDYTVNFTTAMPDINYCAVCSTSGAGASNSMLIQPFTSGTSQITPTTSAIRISTVQALTAITDSSFVQVAIFR
jgi:hypothetical protein